jgi:hypothetical protein
MELSILPGSLRCFSFPGEARFAPRKNFRAPRKNF